MTGLGTGTVHKLKRAIPADCSLDARDVRLTPQGVPEFAASEKKARRSSARGAGLDEGQNFFFERSAALIKLRHLPANWCHGARMCLKAKNPTRFSDCFGC